MSDEPNESNNQNNPDDLGGDPDVPIVHVPTPEHPHHSTIEAQHSGHYTKRSIEFIQQLVHAFMGRFKAKAPVQPAVETITPQDDPAQENPKPPAGMSGPNPLPPHKRKEETQHCRPDQTPWWKYLMELAAILVGIAVAIIYYDQLKVMRGQLGEIVRQYPEIKRTADATVAASNAATESLNTLNKQFQLDQRPYISVECCTPIKDDLIGSQLVPVVGKPIALNVSFVNLGKSPALHVRKYYHLVFGDDRLKNIYVEPEDTTTNGSVLAQGENAKVFITAISLKNAYLPSPSSISTSDLLDWTGETPIAVFGRVTYEDAFENMYCTPFMYVWLHDTTWGSPDRVTIKGKRLPNMCPPEKHY